VASLFPVSPCAGHLGTLTLSEVDPGPVTCVMPLRGQDKAVSAALTKAVGIGFPAPGRMLAKGVARALWTGRRQALVMGVPCPVLDGAACVDQSDGWAMVQIEGQGVEDMLARLVPVDLRAPGFKRGHTARTLLGHMTASVTRTGAARFEVMVFRSMAETLIEDLERAARLITARG